MKVYFASTRTCARRKLDEEKTKEYFLSNGGEITTEREEADCVVVTTCAFRQNRVEESREILESLLGKDTNIIVTGCFPFMEEKAFDAYRRENVFVVSPSNPEGIDELFPGFETGFRNIGDANDFPAKWDEEVFFLRISNGCLFACSYCTIRKAIGRLRSVEPAVISGQLAGFLESDRKGLVLIGDDVGSYGVDIDESFPALLRRISTSVRESKERSAVKIGNLNPWWLLAYREPLLELLADPLLSFMHVSMQSGSDRILELMNRGYCTTDEVVGFLETLKSANPALRLQTDIIVGFPDESRQDFDLTMALLERGLFDIVNVHRYYETEGAASAGILPKVPPDVIEERYGTAVGFLRERNVPGTIEVEGAVTE